LHSMEHFATSRLTAERLNEGHLADLVALHLDPCVSRYLSGVRSPEATKTYLTANITHWDRHGFGLWVLRTRNGEFAGRAGIRHIVVDGASVEIAYTFKRALWGRGLASEIAKALTNFGLTQLRLPSLVGVVSVENGASRRVLEKADFAIERSATYRGEEVVIYRSPSDRAPPNCLSMIRKSGYRFSEKIMLNKKDRAG
jgi:RimJ/RimL family protein N-acetyltransferase